MVASIPPPSNLYRRYRPPRRPDVRPIGTPLFWAALGMIVVLAGLGVALACIATRLMHSAPFPSWALGS